MDGCACILKHFKKIDVNDICLVNNYLKLCEYEESNHNIITIMMWLSLYPLYEYHEDDFMILIGTYKGEYFMYMPLCHKNKALNVIKFGKKLLDDCHIKFKAACFIEEYKDMLVKEYHDVEVYDVRDGYDYVYDLNSLREFKGKKLQKKRNHLNYFYKTYDNRYNYEDLDDANVDELIAFIKNQELEDTLKIEKEGIITILKNRDKLKYKAGIIRIDGKIEAYIIASILSENMIQENVEKANKNIRGLSQAIIKEFFTRHYLTYKYLNREDDMGIENLRKSKLSYEPIYLIKKYYINI